MSGCSSVNFEFCGRFSLYSPPAAPPNPHLWQAGQRPGGPGRQLAAGLCSSAPDGFSEALQKCRLTSTHRMSSYYHSNWGPIVWLSLTYGKRGSILNMVFKRIVVLQYFHLLACKVLKEFITPSQLSQDSHLFLPTWAVKNESLQDSSCFSFFRPHVIHFCNSIKIFFPNGLLMTEVWCGQGALILLQAAGGDTLWDAEAGGAKFQPTPWNLVY